MPLNLLTEHMFANIIISVTTVTDRTERGLNMRSKSIELKREIYDFVNDWKREYSKSPSLKVLADNFGVSRTTIYRYLVEMTEDNMGLIYSADGIETKELNSGNMRLSPAKVVGSIPCGEAQEEEEYVEAYVNLPQNLFGNGDFYILRATGDSMEDAGIFDGDQVLVRKQSTAESGDIVVALMEDGATVKTFYKEKGYYRLQPENDTMDPILIHEGLEILGKVFGVFRLYK